MRRCINICQVNFLLRLLTYARLRPANASVLHAASSVALQFFDSCLARALRLRPVVPLSAARQHAGSLRTALHPRKATAKDASQLSWADKQQKLP